MVDLGRQKRQDKRIWRGTLLLMGRRSVCAEQFHQFCIAFEVRIICAKTHSHMTQHNRYETQSDSKP
jgi:hypothetical protein